MWLQRNSWLPRKLADYDNWLSVSAPRSWQGVLHTSRGFDVIACYPRLEDVGDLLDLCIDLPVLPEIVLMFRLASNGRRQLDGAAAEHLGDAVPVRVPRDLEDGDGQGDAAW
jgi:hypothetical protein